MSYLEIAKKTLSIEAKELERATLTLGSEFDRAVELIYQIEGKLIVTGVGKSGLIGAKIAATFASTGTSSFFIHPTEAMHGDLGMISAGDTLLAISYSGESAEIVDIIPHIKRFNIPLISMSANPNSTLSKNSNVDISIKVQKEACPLNSAPTSSTTLTLALGDALAIALMSKRDFTKEEFASFHPGGALGRRLFLKVEDLMQTKELPIVSKDETLKSAIVKMSQGRLGTVLITDGSRKLLAILSDGDLRRAMLRDDFSLNKKAIEFATKNPKVLDNPKLLASQALEIIESFKIQLLAIVNSKDKVVGVLHIHNLIEAKVDR